MSTANAKAGPDRFWTTRQLADAWQIGLKEVRDLIDEFALPAYRIGKRRLRFRVADVTAFLESRRVTPESGDSMNSQKSGPTV